MGQERRRLTLQRLVAAIALAGLVVAQEAPAPQSRPADSETVPAPLIAALTGVQDGALSFDSAGLRQLLVWVARRSSPPRGPAGSVAIPDWRELIERPGDFRGRWVTVEGVVGRNTSWRFLSGPESELGPVWQLELRGALPDVALACTLLLTQSAADLPLGARVRVSGVFVQVRAYVAESGATRYAPLLVGIAPDQVSVPGRREDSRGEGGSWLLPAGVGLAGLLAAWLFLRARLGAARPLPQPIEPGEAAPFSVAADLQAWAAKDDPDAPPSPPSRARGGQDGDVDAD